MRLVPALLAAALLVACSGVKLPPVSPESLEVYSEPNGQFPPEEYERLGLMDRSFTDDQCARDLKTTSCEDEQVWQFGLQWLKEWAAEQGADALLIHEAGYSTAGNRYMASAIYFPSRHPELEQQ
jgi:hypothetical protein